MRLIAPIQMTLANACRHVPDEPAVLRGELAEIGLVPLLELLERSQCTGKLVLTRGYTTLTLDWIHGSLVVHGARRAVAIALGWKDAWYELLPVSFDGRPDTHSVAELLITMACDADAHSARA